MLQKNWLEDRNPMIAYRLHVSFSPPHIPDTEVTHSPGIVQVVWTTSISNGFFPGLLLICVIFFRQRLGLFLRNWIAVFSTAGISYITNLWLEYRRTSLLLDYLLCKLVSYLVCSLFSFLQDHTRFVNCVRFSPDGNRFATASADGQVKHK